MSYFPFMIDITGDKAIVVGAGRKARTIVRDLIDFGARVTCVAPVISADVVKLGKQCRIERRVYKPGEARDYDIVVAATDNDAINNQVAHDAGKSGAIVTVAGDSGKSGFLFPTILKKEDYSVTIFSESEDPDLSERLKNVIEAAVDGMETEEAQPEEVPEPAGETEEAEDQTRLADIDEENDGELPIPESVEEGDMIRVGVPEGRLQQLRADVAISALGVKGYPSIKVPVQDDGDAMMYALLRGEADVVVTEATEVPLVLPDGLEVSAVLPREDARDVLVTNRGTEKAQIKFIGAGNESEKAQIGRFLTDGEINVIGGPVTSRIERLKDGDLDAVILTAADIDRLKLRSDDSLKFEYLDTDKSLPAAGKGMICIVSRDSGKARDAARGLNDTASGIAFAMERDFLERTGLDADDACSAYAVPVGSGVIMKVMRFAGGKCVYHAGTGESGDPLGLSEKLAERFE